MLSTSVIRTVIAGTGSFLPEKIVTNADLAKIMDTSDEWIRQRTGIEERRIADDTETTGLMATHAARLALEAAGYQGGDIDGVIVATTTPDTTFPAVAVTVQEKLGLQKGPAFDIQAACSGFIYALSAADSMIRCSLAKRMLVIGAEKFSSLVDWNDRTTAVLFGDGAGAVVLEADYSGADNTADRGILSSHLHADGTLRDLLFTNGGAASTRSAGHIVMEGKEVFRNAVTMMSEIVDEVLQTNAIQAADIDWLVPHQANIRIIEATAKKLNMAMDQIVVTVDKQGNTSAASIPLALDTAVRDGRIQRNDLILMEALGGGLTWGAILLRY